MIPAVVMAAAVIVVARRLRVRVRRRTHRRIRPTAQRPGLTEGGSSLAYCVVRTRRAGGVRRRTGHDLSPNGTITMLPPTAVAFLERLLDTPGPSGFESAPARLWREEAARFATVRGDVH